MRLFFMIMLVFLFPSFAYSASTSRSLYDDDSDLKQSLSPLSSLSVSSLTLSYAVSAVTDLDDDEDIYTWLENEGGLPLPKESERLAVAFYKDNFPQYTILSNVIYTKLRGDRPGKVQGELDVIVLDGHELKIVTEVKYAGGQKNLNKAIRRGIHQMEKFVVNCLVRHCMFLKGDEIVDVLIPREPRGVSVGVMAFTGKRNDLSYGYTALPVNKLKRRF